MNRHLCVTVHGCIFIGDETIGQEERAEGTILKKKKKRKKTVCLDIILTRHITPYESCEIAVLLQIDISILEMYRT